MTSLVKAFGFRKVAGQEEIANKKSKLIYRTLESYPDIYQIVPDQTVRSRMNICFRVGGSSAEKEKEFLAGAEAQYLTGLKGHRSVGGIRISNYNAVSMENVERLVVYLESYAKQ